MQALQKRQFKYSGDTPNGPLSGVIWATSVSEAMLIAKRMGVANPQIEDPSIPAEDRIVATPAPLPTETTISQEERILQAVQPKNPIPATMVPSLSSEQKTQIMAHVESENIGQPVKPLTKEDPPVAAMLRDIMGVEQATRQELFIGGREEALSFTNQVLGDSDRRGKVISIQMHPDGQGKLIFAIVVEYKLA